MSVLFALTKRNAKVFLKEKGLFLSSLVGPAIILFLYIAFLSNVYRDIFASSLPETVDKVLVNSLVSGNLLASILAVTCISVPFGVALVSVKDKVTGVRNDIFTSPVKKSIVSFAYFLANYLVSILICFIILIAGLIYVAITGWNYNVADIFIIILDTLLLVAFGSSLSAVVTYPLKSEGQISAVTAIIGSAYGFISGAYMPIAQYGEGLRNALAFFPGLYGTSLFRKHTMGGAFRELSDLNWPAESIKTLGDSVDCNIYFFGNEVTATACYIVLVGFTVLLIGIYVLLNVLKNRKAGSSK